MALFTIGDAASSEESSSGSSAQASPVTVIRQDSVLIGDSRRGSVDLELTLSPKEIAAVWIDRLGLLASQAQLPDDFGSIALDESNQRVIRYDCERTRGSMEEFKLTETREVLERLLTFYCKSHNISYKQGMNEVLAPFVALKLWGAVDSWSQVYNMYSSFIDIFLPNMFSDDEFNFLQQCCVLFRTCLRYHAPSLSGRLDTAAVTPEMYVTPWFLTLFASKSSIPAILQLWHFLITKGDKHSFVFVATSLCLSHARILRASAKVSLPETITKIAVTEESVNSIWRRAVKIRQHTPPYFLQQLLNAAERETDDGITATHLVKQLGEVVPMTVRPMDLFRPRTSHGWKYVVLDCRPEWVINAGSIGSLPLSVAFDLESLVTGQNVFPVSEALKRVGDLLGVDITASVPQWPLDSHICIMGLADAVVDAVGLFYLALSKFSNVPRLSILKGGYSAVHNETPQELIDHDPNICPLCCGTSITSFAEKPIRRARAGSTSSSIADSSGASSPGTPFGGGGSIFNRLKTFVSESSSVVASGTTSLIDTGSRFIVGVSQPIPTSKAQFAPQKDQSVMKCRLVDIMGRTPGSDIEANALLVVSNEAVKCYAAPLDMTILTGKCELRLYGGWPVAEVAKITSKTGNPDTLMLYFSVESDPDLVVTFVNASVAKGVVDDIRKKFRSAKKQSISE